MVREKLGWFMKGLARIGRYLVYRQKPKINFLTTLLVLRAVMQEYAEILGSTEEGLLRLGKSQRVIASRVVLNMIEDPLLFGIKMGTILSRDISDTAFLIDMALKVLIGSDATKIFETPIFIPAEDTDDGIPKVICTLKKCPLCAGLTSHVTAEMLGEAEYLAVITSLGESAVQVIQDFVGNSYNIVCKETKCILKGDEKGEMTVYFYPKTE